MKTLIADCGSTKVQWLLVEEGNSTPILDFLTTGFNAAVSSPDEIRQILSHELLPQINGHDISRLHFYGAGCIGEEVDRRLQNLLSELIGIPYIEIASDLLGAARALFGHTPGIACILGTGSNSGLYDGERIIANTPPLGYILGDEGSGASLGRRLLGDIYKGLLPQEIIADFNAEFSLSKSDIIERVYRRPGANRFLASFCPFIHSHLSSTPLSEMVIAEFRLFLRRNLSPYSAIPTSPLPVGFIGSIAHHFSPQLLEACLLESYPSPCIASTPSPGLLAFHLSL